MAIARKEPRLESASRRAFVDRPSPLIDDEARIAYTFPEANWRSQPGSTFNTTKSGHVNNVAGDYIDQSVTYNDGAGGAFFFHRADNSFLEQHHLSGTRAVDTNVRVKGIQDNQKNGHIKKWMKAPDTSLNYKVALDTHQGGTGSWFTSCPEFVTWKQKGSVLWLHGKPGSGKTILCSLAIKDVKAVCGGAVSYAYFFFDGRDGSELSRHESLIRSLIMQFSAQCDGIPLALNELYTNECRNGLDQPSIASLERTLWSIIDSSDVSYIIVDALDECGEQHRLLQWIRSVTAPSGQLRLMVISRPEPDLKRGLMSIKGLTIISVADERAADDIRQYIDTRLSTSDWSDETKDLIRKGLVRGADGMQVPQQTCMMIYEADGSLEDQLQSLPQGLNETYEKILKRRSSRPRDASDLKLFLQLLACANRPLRVKELAEAVIVTSTPSGHGCNLARRYGRPSDVLKICYGLVTEVDGFVKLAHFSVKEFLSSEEIQRGDANGPRGTALHGAAFYGQLEVFKLLLQLGADIDIKGGEHGTVLQAASSAGSAEIVALLLEKGADPNVGGGVYGSALQAASYRRSAEIVTLLLEKGVDPNIGGGEHGSALQIASDHGSAEILTLLLEKGADPNIGGGKYGSALQAASYADSAEIVMLLLERGAQVNAEGGTYGTALQAASYRGLAEIVTLLLDKGASPNVGGGVYGSALQAASYRRSAEIVTLLLDTGADPNIGGGKYGSALQAASYADSAEIVMLLLERGAQVNAEGGTYGTALQAACYQRSVEIVMLLLQKGAHVNAEGGIYGSALQAACYQRSVEVVELLLEWSADVNIVGGKYGTALQAASYSGEAEIVKLLLQNGTDVNAEGGEHGTAIRAARAKSEWYYGKTEAEVDVIVSLLKEHGAVETEPVLVASSVL
ncbi:hypothetical protein HWV62_37187 [Athelia sp. TMB]|nr:hypothetical protein HWV62_37187 [Athelia sp. TMB]